jgi:hypothetical protein
VTTPKARRIRFAAQPFFPCLLLVLGFSALNSRVLPLVDAAPTSKNLKPTDPYALIFGTVWGPDNHAVFGVKVNIRRVPDKRPKWELYSDHAGEFAQRIAAGKNDYIVGADLKGVKTTDGHRLHLVEEVPVHVEYDERVDIGLHLTWEDK